MPIMLSLQSLTSHKKEIVSRLGISMEFNIIDKT